MANEFKLNYSGPEINERLGAIDKKADLDENGKIPVEQIPDDVGRTQLQADFAQEDVSALDYIKNKPFYSEPPEYNFNFDISYTLNPITWDGNVENRPGFCCQDIYYYKVSDVFVNEETLKNGYVKLSFPLENMEMPKDFEVKNYSMLSPITQELIEEGVVYSDKNHCISMFLCSATEAGVFSTMIDEMVYEIEFPEPGTYFLYDKSGNIFSEGYYVSSISGSLVDFDDNDESLLIINDFASSGGKLVAKKVYDNFIEKEKIKDFWFDFSMADWSRIFEDGGNFYVKYHPDMFDEMFEIVDFEDGSYAITMGGLPVFASIKDTIAESGMDFAGPATYLCYIDMVDTAGMELWMNKIHSSEKVMQIDSKYIPKQKLPKFDYNEMNPESSKYILNKPYYSKEYYDSFYGVLDESLQILHNEDRTKFYQWGYYIDDLKSPDFYNDEYCDIISTYVNWDIPSQSLSKTLRKRRSASGNKVKYFYDSNYNSGKTTYTVWGYLSFEDNITSSVINPWTGQNESIYFPKAGIYYLCDTSVTPMSYVSQLGLYRQRNNLPKSDWKANEGDKGYIYNKPANVLSTNYTSNLSNINLLDLTETVSITNDACFRYVDELTFENQIKQGGVNLDYLYTNIDGRDIAFNNVYGWWNGTTILRFDLDKATINSSLNLGASTVLAYITGKNSYVQIRFNSDYYYITFPKPGWYILDAQSYNFYIKGLYAITQYYIDSSYQIDWNETRERHPKYIQNKPSITDKVSEYSSALVTSGGVYNALQSLSVSAAAIDDETGEITNPLDNYYTKAEVDALLDEIRQLIQTNN